jgi:hypothetical protein
MELGRRAQVGDATQSIGPREIYDRDERTGVKKRKMEEDII